MELDSDAQFVLGELTRKLALVGESKSEELYTRLVEIARLKEYLYTSGVEIIRSDVGIMYTAKRTSLRNKTLETRH